MKKIAEPPFSQEWLLSGCLWFLAVAGTLGLVGEARAQTEPAVSPPVAALKKLSVEELMDIEVTSVSRRPERLSDTPSAIQVITGDDIRRSGATSLPRALRQASNLNVAQVDASQWAISARGFNATTADKLLVMIDGRTVYTPLYAGMFWDVQDTFMEDLDRIEVISGPGATLWGANAVNGVINVMTKSARDTLGTAVYAGDGDASHGMAGLRHGMALGKHGYARVYGKYFDRDGAVRPDGSDAGNRWRMTQTGFRSDWDVGPEDSVTVQGDFYDGAIGQLSQNDSKVSGNNLLGRWSHSADARHGTSLQLYCDRTHRQIPGSATDDLHTYDLDFQNRISAGERNDLVWGLGYRLIDDTVTNLPTLAFLPASVTRRLFTGFVQDDITIVPEQFHLTLGSKIEHNDYTGFEWQPSIRGTWVVAPKHTLWSSVSRAVRTPSRIDRDLYAPRDPPHLIVGGSNFHSETVVAYEAGYRMQPQDNLLLTASGFYNDYDHIRSTERVSPSSPFPITLGNGQHGRSYGVELTADWHATDRLRLCAGYTRLVVRIRPNAGSTDTSLGNVESHDPSQQIFLRAAVDLPRDWEFDATYRHVAEIANQLVPAYDEIDLRVGWRPVPMVEVSLVGQNLLHDRHPEFGLPATRQEIERSVHGKITCRF